jgi:hypothetical protein
MTVALIKLSVPPVEWITSSILALVQPEIFTRRKFSSSALNGELLFPNFFVLHVLMVTIMVHGHIGKLLFHHSWACPMKSFGDNYYFSFYGY